MSRGESVVYAWGRDCNAELGQHARSASDEADGEAPCEPGRESEPGEASGEAPGRESESGPSAELSGWEGPLKPVDPGQVPMSRFEEDPRCVRALCGARVAAVSCGFFHSQAVTSTGGLYTWGAGSGGQLGQPHTTATMATGGPKAVVGRPEPVGVLKALRQRVVCAAGGRNHTVAIGYNGLAYAWGRATDGQLGHGVVTPGATRRILDADVAEPKQLLPYDGAPPLPRLVAVAAGEHFTAALSDGGEVLTWGRAHNGRLGRHCAHQGEPRSLPPRLFCGQRVAQVALGWRHVLARTHHGQLFAWGAGDAGQLGSGNRRDEPAPRPVEALVREKVALLGAGCSHSLACTAEGVLFAWGENSAGQLGLGHARDQLRPAGVCSMLDAAPLLLLDCGALHSAVVTCAGRLFTCGDDRYGQLGTAEREDGEQATASGAGPAETLAGGDGPVDAAPDARRRCQLRPVALPPEFRVTGAACGAWHTVAVLSRRSRES